MQADAQDHVLSQADALTKNPVYKSLSVLISHIRAASYVLVIVAVYFVAWAPFFVFGILNSVNNLGKPHKDSQINTRLIKECLKYAVRFV